MLIYLSFGQIKISTKYLLMQYSCMKMNRWPVYHNKTINYFHDWYRARIYVLCVSKLILQNISLLINIVEIGKLVIYSKLCKQYCRTL